MSHGMPATVFFPSSASPAVPSQRVRRELFACLAARKGDALSGVRHCQPLGEICGACLRAPSL